MPPALPIAVILNQYRRLIDYCDEFFTRVRQSQSHEMSCGPGCSYCCTLQTVCALEAAIIASWVKQSGFRDAMKTPVSADVCPLLCGNRCCAYVVRPVICRTHGLLLSASQETVRSCQMNFALITPGEAPKTDILDNERVTMNLMKLNLAFTMEIGRRDEAELRFDLRDVVRLRLPPEYILIR